MGEMIISKIHETILSISSFGGFSISALDASNMECVMFKLSDSKRPTSKIWLLIEYLIFSGKEAVAFEEIIELLWPNEGDVGNPIAALRILVHRARAELDKLGEGMGALLILRRNNAYSWNRDVPMQIDTELFAQLYAESQKASGSERIELLLSAARLYAGRFLYGAAYNQWAMIQETYYHSMYVSICEEAVSLLESFSFARDIVELCRNAIALEPYSETLQIAYMKALVSLGAQKMALEHYYHITHVLMNDLAITPSQKLSEIYKLITKNEEGAETDIDTIYKSLTDRSTNALGAYYVEYEPFKHLYEIKSRESIRTGHALQIVLVTVLPSKGKTPGQRSKMRFMERLLDIVKISLRRGDIVTRCSNMQYLVLMQSATYEDVQLVVERIQANLRQTHPKSGYLLQCVTRTIEPRSLPKDVEG